MLHSDYVNMLIEHVEGLSRECLLMQDETSIIDAIESYRPVVSQDHSIGAEFVAEQIINFLMEVFHDKVPRQVFEKKCAERGLKPEEIAKAEKVHSNKLR